MNLKLSLFTLTLCLGIASRGQETKNEPEQLPLTTVLEDNQVYNSVEIKPEFPGGMEAFYKYISRNYRMPEEYINGTVYVTFVIEKDGSLSEIKVIRDLGYGTGIEALRIIKDSPKWKPGMQNGRTVRTQFSLPIKIVIPDVPSAEEKVYDKPEIAPEYPGGMNAFHDNILNQLHIPADSNGASEIIAEFIIERDGKVYSAWINKDIGGDSAAQVLRILKQPPLWKPGTQDGKAVRTRLIIPIKVSSK